MGGFLPSAASTILGQLMGKESEMKCLTGVYSAVSASLANAIIAKAKEYAQSKPWLHLASKLWPS